MDFYIGQIFEEMYPPEAAEWCNSNNAMIVDIEPVIRLVVEEYETTEIQDVIVPAITHIETDENGVEYEIIDEPERTEQWEVPVVKTREVEKELRCFQIAEMPAPSQEEINQARIDELKGLLADTDWVVIKIAESDTIEGQEELRKQYANIISERKAWRAEINALEEE